MLTIRAEVRREEQRKDGTFRVKIRFTQNRKIKRLPTKLFAKKSDLNKSFELQEGTDRHKLCKKIAVLATLSYF